MKRSTTIRLALLSVVAFSGSAKAVHNAADDIVPCSTVRDSAEVGFRFVVFITDAKHSMTYPSTMNITIMKMIDWSYYVKAFSGKVSFLADNRLCPESGCDGSLEFRQYLRNVGPKKDEFYSLFLDVEKDGAYRLNIQQKTSDKNEIVETHYCTPAVKNTEDHNFYLNLPEKKSL